MDDGHVMVYDRDHVYLRHKAGVSPYVMIPNHQVIQDL